MLSGHLIGVDVGGTKVAVATLEGQRLGESDIRPTEASSADELIDEIAAAVDSARAPATVGVGIGVPSVVEFATGRVRSSVNLHMADLDLQQVLEDRLGLPVFVDNDATVAALGEAFDDAGRATVENLVMFTVGTGIGGGLVLAGRVYRGATGAAGELGHTLVGATLADGAPPSGDFPQAGSLESLAAGRVLDRLAEAIAERDPGSPLGRILAEAGSVDGHDAVEAAEAADPEAIGALRLLGERLGVGIANAINTFDPDVVAVGGGVSIAGELLLGPARETARRYVLPGVGERTEVRLARHGNRAGVRGAALLAGLELAGADAVQPRTGAGRP
ncbi:MAG: ROK family protein [Solirubrobacterales bacterium]